MSEYISSDIPSSSPAMTPQQRLLTQQSGFQLYKTLAVGNASLLSLLYYEFALTLFSGLPGLIGYGSRRILFPSLFGRCGSKPAFGRGLVLRNLKKVKIGSKLLLDDYCTLDLRGDSAAMTIGDCVSIGRFSSLTAKEGTIEVGNGVNIGTHCRIATQSKIEIGTSTLIAAYAYIGPGNHKPGDDNAPLIEQQMDIKGGVKIGAHVWIGTRATILDGVTIGDGAVVGAHSLVREDVPAGAIVAGTPAKIVEKGTLPFSQRGKG